MDIKEMYLGFEEMMETKAKAKPYAKNLLLWEAAKIGRRQMEGEVPLVWTRCTFPAEIISAFGALPIYTEMVGTVLSIMGHTENILKRTEEQFFSSDSCSIQRAPLGAALEGGFPAPQLLIGSTDYCENGMRFFEHLSQYFGREYVLVEIPFEYSEDSVSYVERQLKEIVNKLSQVTSTPFDIDRLRELVKYRNQTMRYQVKINELRKKIPTPLPGRRCGDFLLMVDQLAGGKSILEFTKRFYEEILTLSKEENLKKEEKIRLLWIYVFPFGLSEIFHVLEKEYCAHIVMEDLSHIYWDEIDEVDPLRGLARKMCQSYTVGAIESRTHQARSLAQDYQVQGAIHFSHFGCRYTRGGVRILKDTLAQVGVPLLSLEGDCLNQENNSPVQMLAHVEAFMEILSQ
ncbi:MAG: 2-hydroxyacyl-CoA dehydratase family protein [Desulfobacteria bacterium]|jgi:benzoyl-CoA reductase/2-hydroxyglutaryl-CoA dehydratase subunit BcrC/BadD/HgdB